MRKSKRNYNQLSTDLNSLSISTSAQKDAKKLPKRSSKPLPPPSIQELSDIDLFKVLSKAKPDIPDILSTLEEEIKDHHDIVLRNFLLFFLKLLGLEEIALIYQEVDVLKLDMKEMIDKVYGYFEIIDTNPLAPILGGGKTKILLKNLDKFLHSLFLENDLLIYKAKLFSCLFMWLQALSHCNVRLVRLGVLELLMFILRNLIELLEKIEEENERLSRLESDEDKKKILVNKLDFINKFLYELLDEVLFPREKDIRNEIREKFIEINEFLLMKYPKKFIRGASLPALMSILFRKEELEHIKCQVLAIFIKLYDPEVEKFNEFKDFLKSFLQNEDFAKKVQSFALNPSIKCSYLALELVININRKFIDLNPIAKDFNKVDKLVFMGSKESRRKISMKLLKEAFESERNANYSVSEKIRTLITFLKEIEEGKIEDLRKFELFLEEGHEYMIENSKPEDWMSFLLEKKVLKDIKSFNLEEFLLFMRIFLEKTNTSKPELINEFSRLFLINLDNIINRLKHELEAFTQLLKILALFEISSFSAPETLDSIKFLMKNIRNSLGFMKNLDFFKETLSLMTSFSKASSHLKEIAEEFINKLVKDELESFQASFIQIFRNQLNLEILVGKSELFQGLKLDLQKIGLLLKFFKIPAFLEDSFLMEINEGCQNKMDVEKEEKKENEPDEADEIERSETRALFLRILGFAHYWLLREIFQDPDDLTNYTFYLKIRDIYLMNLSSILSKPDKAHPLMSHAFELSISFLSLLSNDKMTKLKGIYISPNEEIFSLILAFLEASIKSKSNYPVFTQVFNLFSRPFQGLKIMLSIFGKSFMKSALYEALWGKSNLSGQLFDILRSLKETEAQSQNKATLTFWRLIQDLLFEIINDHSLSNTEQSQIGLFLSKTVLKLYFASTGSEKDSIYLEKYVIFLADTIVRGLENSSDLLSFSFLNSMLYKLMLEKDHVRKLSDFLRLERLKTEEKLKIKGKSLDKMENFSYLEKFEASLEKLIKEKPKKSVKKNIEKEKEIMEEEKKEEVLESKRKEIIEELEEKRKEVREEEEEEIEEKETLNVLEFNKEEKPKRKAQKKKVK